MIYLLVISSLSLLTVSAKLSQTEQKQTFEHLHMATILYSGCLG